MIAWPFLLLASGLAAASASAQEPTPREPPISGGVVSRISGERVRFVAEPAFLPLALGQDLIGGDLVRTGPAGAVGILFADGTVMRLHANTELLVNAVRSEGAELTLLEGAFWARAPRDAADLTVLTPSAAAAIRGTDWALSVEEDGTTRLAVYDGRVELSNPQGAVVASAGQGAVAAPGLAPALVRVADRREAAQMLFTLGTGDVLAPILGAAEELAGEAAENAAALADYRRGVALMRERRWREAAEAFAEAAPALGPERAAAARWLSALALAEAGEPPAWPAPEGAAMDEVGAAFAAALRGDLDEAATRLAAAQPSPTTLAALTQLAIVRDEPETAAAAVDRLRREAPGSVPALQAEADYLGDVLGDWPAAVERLERAVALEPERVDLWNDLGLARRAVDHSLEAEAAFRRALALGPGDPAPAGNLAILLLEQERVAEARAVAEALLEADPGSYLGLRAKGLVEVRSGEPGARETLLKALAAQPAAAETSIMLAIASWQEGDRVRALQELDAAARLDPNDATVPLVRTVIALDEADAGTAIRAAREATTLLARQGGETRLVAADRETGSYLAEAFSSVGLEGWARYVADRAYDPLSAASLFGEATLERPAIGRTGPAASGGEAAAVQGLLLEPLAASFRLRTTDLLRRPFLDSELTGARVVGDIEGSSGALSIQGFDRVPAPVSFAATVSGSRLDGPAEDGEARNLSGSLLLGTQLGARFGGFAMLGFDRNDGRDVEDVFTLEQRDEDERDGLSGGVGASWRLGERRFLTGFASVSALDAVEEARRFAPTPFGVAQIDVRAESRRAAQFLGLGYRGEDLSGAWIGGVEGLRVVEDTDSEAVVTDLFTGERTRVEERGDEERLLGRAYLDRRHRLGEAVEVELGLAANLSDDGGGLALAPRAGLAWSPAEGQWLRAALLRDANAGLTTLGPVSTLGLIPLAPELGAEGELWGGILRWDGEFGDRLHLGVEHQSLRYEDLNYETGDPFAAFAIPRATLHATSARADLWLGAGFGVYAGVAHAASRIEEGPSEGEDLPETPDWTARVGAAFLLPSRLSGSIEGVWTSERSFGTDEARLDPVLTVDLGLNWEPLDRRLAFGLRAENILDAELERPFGQEPIGRAVWLSASARF